MASNLAEQFAPIVPDARFAAGKLTNEKLAVVGLGYVGLPVAVALSRKYEGVIGFDVSADRVEELCRAEDRTGEVDKAQIKSSGATFTCAQEDLSGATVYIVAVPTPVDDGGRPDFGPLRQACQLIAPCLTPGAIVVFESTVYPGATEEVCANELEIYSGYNEGVEFHVAYSPERINPGDKARGINTVTKIVAAKSGVVLDRIADVYGSIVEAGIHKTSSIKVAEAAKVFENTQRDVNIALANEFARICDRIGIPTREVLLATGTKWNALPFSPGLVGGHCIGVDPLYLTAKAQEVGIHPEIMLASRRTNDRVPHDIANKALKFLTEHDKRPSEARIGVLGVTFKENVPDTRNSKVVATIQVLRDHGISPLIHDPVASRSDLLRNGIRSTPLDAMKDLDVLILAVPHRSYVADGGQYLQSLISEGGVMMDIRATLAEAPRRDDIAYWSL